MTSFPSRTLHCIIPHSTYFSDMQLCTYYYIPSQIKFDKSISYIDRASKLSASSISSVLASLASNSVVTQALVLYRHHPPYMVIS